jgi:Tol biopolymer transport system component
VKGDTNNHGDIFIRDLQENTTQLVSVATGGRDACVRPPEEESQCCSGPSLSPDGRFVAFASIAPDLVAADSNGISDVFVHDTQTRTTIRASLSASGSEILCGPFAEECPPGGAAISAEGRFVAFQSDAGDIVPGDRNYDPDVFVRGPLP